MTETARPRQPRSRGESIQPKGARHASALDYNIYTPSGPPVRHEDSFDPHPVADLNWVHPKHLRALPTRHSLHARHLLNLIDDRIERFRGRFGITHAHEDNYRKKASMIALSDAHFREKFCHCSIPNSKNPAGTCGIRKFCPYCNHRVRERAQMTYVPAFDKGQWYFCTLSFQGLVSMEGDEVSLGLYWDACNAAIQALLHERHIHGAYWSEELFVRELYPALRVIPHAHAVLHCNNAAELDLDAAREFLEGFMRLYLKTVVGRDRDLDDIAPQLLLPPSVRLKPLPAQRDLFYATGYVTKTIKLVDVYEAALDALEPSEWWRANSQLNLFFEGLESEMLEETPSGRPWNRRQLFRAGTLRSQSRSFVGVPRADRSTRADRQRLRKLLNEVMKQPSRWNPADDELFAFEDAMLDELFAANELGGSDGSDDGIA